MTYRQKRHVGRKQKVWRRDALPCFLLPDTRFPLLVTFISPSHLPLYMRVPQPASLYLQFPLSADFAIREFPAHRPVLTSYVHLCQQISSPTRKSCVFCIDLFYTPTRTISYYLSNSYCPSNPLTFNKTGYSEISDVSNHTKRNSHTPKTRYFAIAAIQRRTLPHPKPATSKYQMFQIIRNTETTLKNPATLQ